MANELESPLTEQLRMMATGPVECEQCGNARGSAELEMCLPNFGCGYRQSKMSPADAMVLLEAADTIDDFEVAFDLGWAADMRAIKMWQNANPGNDLVWTDHAHLVVWLMAQVDDMRLAREDRDGVCAAR